MGALGVEMDAVSGGLLNPECFSRDYAAGPPDASTRPPIHARVSLDAHDPAVRAGSLHRRLTCSGGCADPGEPEH